MVRPDAEAPAAVRANGDGETTCRREIGLRDDLARRVEENLPLLNLNVQKSQVRAVEPSFVLQGAAQPRGSVQIPAPPFLFTT